MVSKHHSIREDTKRPRATAVDFLETRILTIQPDTSAKSNITWTEHSWYNS